MTKRPQKSTIRVRARAQTQKFTKLEPYIHHGSIFQIDVQEKRLSRDWKSLQEEKTEQQSLELLRGLGDSTREEALAEKGFPKVCKDTFFGYFANS